MKYHPNSVGLNHMKNYVMQDLSDLILTDLAKQMHVGREFTYIHIPNVCMSTFIQISHNIRLNLDWEVSFMICPVGKVVVVVVVVVAVVFLDGDTRPWQHSRRNC